MTDKTIFAKRRPTYKRHAAVGLALFLMGLAVYAMQGTDPALVNARAAIVNALAIPVFAFLAAAFGMDWIGKQTNWGGPQMFDQQYPPQSYAAQFQQNVQPVIVEPPHNPAGD